MPHFAAHDEHSIYAIADTPEAAIAKARTDGGDPGAAFEAARVSDALAERIEADGWNPNARSFEVVDGEIVDTTDRSAAPAL